MSIRTITHFIFHVTAFCVCVIIAAGLPGAAKAGADFENCEEEIYGTAHHVGYEVDTQEIQALIRGQLSAIRDRNAEQAYGYVSENLHHRYRTPGAFLNQMRYVYRPIYNHVQHRFLDFSMTGNSIIQKVGLTDRAGHEVVVIYRLVPQDDNTLRIESFAVLGNMEDAQPI